MIHTNVRFNDIPPHTQRCFFSSPSYWWHLFNDGSCTPYDTAHYCIQHSLTPKLTLRPRLLEWDQGEQGKLMTESRGWRRHLPRDGGGRQEASQYGGTLHNSLTVLIYHLADLAPGQYAIAFVIFELEPWQRERDMGRWMAQRRQSKRGGGSRENFGMEPK